MSLDSKLLYFHCCAHYVIPILSDWSISVCDYYRSMHNACFVSVPISLPFKIKFKKLVTRTRASAQKRPHENSRDSHDDFLEM